MVQGPALPTQANKAKSEANHNTWSVFSHSTYMFVLATGSVIPSTELSPFEVSGPAECLASDYRIKYFHSQE